MAQQLKETATQPEGWPKFDALAHMVDGENWLLNASLKPL